MQTTSPVWKGLFASGAALQARATVGGTVYTDIGVPVINRATMQDRLAVGNVVSASLSLALRSAGSVPRSAAVVIEVRMNDGQTASEWLPQGTFYISRRMRDPVTGLLALECYDALLKANAVWVPSAGAWPRTLAAVTAELAALLGVTLDSRTVIPTGAAYAMSEPDEGTTIRDALSLVAQAAGGNWIITPAGKLRLVRLGEAGDTVDVAGVVGGIDVGQAGTITGVRSTVDGVATLTGDDTGIVVDVALAPVIAVELAEALIGQAWQPFRLEGAVYDPAAELGDAVRAGANGEVASALCSEQAAYGPAFRGDIAAPDPGEVTDEYPYIGSAERTLALAKAAVDRAVARYDDNLTQQEIFNRLTDNGAAQGMILYGGQLYINASYVNAGVLSAARIGANSIAVEKLTGSIIGGLNNSWALNLTNGTLTIGNISASNITTGTMSAARIGANSIAVEKLTGSIIGGLNNSWVLNLTNGTLTIGNISASNITTGTMSAARIKGDTLTLGGANNVNGTMQVLNANGDAVVTMNQDGATINSGSIVSYSANKLYRSKVETGGIVLEGYVASQSEPIAKWRSLLQLVNTLGQTAEGSQSYLVGAGDVNLSAGDLHTVRITGGTTTMPDGRSAIEVGNSGIKLAGAVSFTDPASARANLKITPANIGAVAKSGDTMTGNLTVKNPTANTNTQISVQTTRNSGAVTIRADQEGGNITILSPNGKTFEIDAYNDNTIRVYSFDDSSPAVYKHVTFNRLTGALSATGGFLGNATNVTGTVAVTHGGTGATTPAAARTNLEITPANIGAAANIMLGSGDTTPSTIYNKVKVLSYANRDGALIHIDQAALNVLTNRTNFTGAYSGLITRSAANTYRFLLTNGGSTMICFYANITSSAITPGNIYRYSGTLMS